MRVAAPIFDAVSAGVRVTFLDGTQRTFCGTLGVCAGDMLERWNLLFVRRNVSPFSVKTKDEQTVPLTPPTEMRSMSGTAIVYQNAVAFSRTHERVKTKVIAHLRKAGLKATFDSSNRLKLPFMYRQCDWAAAFRHGVGLLRVGADPIHTFGAGVDRRLLAMAAWVVFHHTRAQFIIDKGHNQGSVVAALAALALLNDAIKRVERFPELKHMANDYFEKFDAKLA